MSKIAFLFPGQGSQKVGMGTDYFATNEKAAAIVNEADTALGFSISELMKEGPEDTLKQTAYAQPALVTMSTALLQLFKDEGIQPDYVAGHSLGEYSALVASEALPFAEAVRLVHKRGTLMEQAVPNGQGAMVAVLGLDQDTLQSICEEVTSAGNAVNVANLNCPGQVVLSGTATGIEQASALAKEKGARRALPLAVSGPFHSSLMKPASEQFESDLHSATITMPMVPVIANVTADEIHAPEVIGALLAEQLYSPVRFEESVNRMIELGVDTFIEIGPGNVLTGLVKKINRQVQAHAVQDQASFDNVLGILKGE
ncbi:ACP S-malonyltransferase [Shouchella lehensis]|uniref:Malonyl CoA-acyl carrier protein transacylase n=1 Tax=Shouchella lehensis TaxID=300825 RepID=A0A4Y7WQQ1_9BACI|nr:ACP S-malonyltransferase [Shouchella lehensis]MBG9784280.1 malonyl CoA-ACP transacylase [Shouchella lehensis]TES50731.1 ACP S-malonyltransferase [Shouchella lehensis]